MKNKKKERGLLYIDVLLTATLVLIFFSVLQVYITNSLLYIRKAEEHDYVLQKAQYYMEEGKGTYKSTGVAPTGIVRDGAFTVLLEQKREGVDGVMLDSYTVTVKKEGLEPYTLSTFLAL